MRIDNVDVRNLGVLHITNDITDREFTTTDSSWLKSQIAPTWGSLKQSFKTLVVQLYIKGNRDTYDRVIGTVLSKLLGVVNLTFDNRQREYRAILVSNSTDSTVPGEYVKLHLTFLCYEHAPQITELINRQTTKTLNVPGNTLTPAIVQITPSAAIADLTITGMGYDPGRNINRPLKLITPPGGTIIAGGETITVDGERGLVTDGGGRNRYANTDIWLFPCLRPGANTITVSRSNIDITVKYYPRFI